jgi:O-antigen ligase
MATRLISLRREPGAPGPFRVASRRLGSLFWGTNLRRTLTALALVLAAAGAYFLVLQRPPARLLQVAVVLSVFLVILSKPHAGILALRVYRLFQQGLNLESLVRGLGVTMVKSIGLFTLIAFIALVVNKKIKPVFGHKIQLIFFYGLFAAILISAFAAFRWKSVGTQIFQVAQNLILYIIFINLFAEAKWLSRFLWISLLATVAACLSGFLSVVLQDVIRAGGTLGNANGMAMVANHAAAVWLVLLLAEAAGRRRILYLFGLSFSSIMIIFTGSRGGLLTLIITFAYQMIKRRKNLIPYFVAALILVAAFAVIPGKYKVRQEEWFGAIFAGETEEVTGGSRGFVYRSALEIFKRSPIFGVGPRTFGAIYQEEYAYKAKGPVTGVRVAHSGILEVLVENGLLGFTFFVGLIISTFLIFRANGKRCHQAGLPRYLLLNDMYEAWFVAIIVGGSFETILKGNAFFLALAAAASIHRASVKLAAAQEETAALVPAPQPAPG